MNTRCPPKRVPSAARFVTLCRLTVQPPQSFSVGGQRSSGQLKGKPAGARPDYRGRWCAISLPTGEGAGEEEQAEPRCAASQTRLPSLTNGNGMGNTKGDVAQGSVPSGKNIPPNLDWADDYSHHTLSYPVTTWCHRGMDPATFVAVLEALDSRREVEERRMEE
ncbi:UNVERIFIED_CONTAM: hypothetical protein FKN15_039057 [Acipenser sinensis]